MSREMDELARRNAALLRELEEACGIVDKPLKLEVQKEDQSQAGPWWVVPALALFALALVLMGHLIAEAAPVG